MIVRHNGEEKVFDLAKRNQYRAQYLSFYADCEHEIRPITVGYRLALVYNLISEVEGDHIAPPSRAGLIADMQEALDLWNITPNSQDRIVYMLEHRYTEDGLKKISQLKGADRAVGVLFVELQTKDLVEGALVFVKLTEMGDTGGKFFIIYRRSLERGKKIC